MAETSTADKSKQPDTPSDQRTAPGSGGHDFARKLSSAREVKLGYLVIFGFIGLVLAWAASVPLHSAAIAPGVVSVEGSRKAVQHLGGGIVENILINEGDYVEQGQLLIELDDVQLRSEFEVIKLQLILATAREARWQAEYFAQPVPIFNQWLLDQQDDDPQVADAMRSQIDVYRSRIAVFDEAKNTLSHRKAQAHERINGSNERLAGLEKRLSLVKQEAWAYEKLKKQGLATRKSTYDLKMQRSELELDISESQAEAAEGTELLAQYESELEQLDSNRKRESSEKLDELRDEIARLKQRFAALESQLARARITAPASGYIVNLKTNTLGGVAPSGDTLLEIVPNLKRLVIEANVDPSNRDTVQPGQSAKIRFRAFNQRNAVPVEGIVRLISADSFLDSNTQAPFYKTIIELVGDPKEALSGTDIFPGMQAEVMIITGERTPLQYLFSPITQSFSRALRED